MLALLVVFGCGFQPESGDYDVDLRVTDVDATAGWNLALAVDATDVWRVKRTGDGVQFHATADCTLSDNAFRCEPYAVVNDGVHGDLQLEGAWDDERTFGGAPGRLTCQALRAVSRLSSSSVGMPTPCARERT